MKWKTLISAIKNNTTLVRGTPLTELATRYSFVHNIYFILTGKHATPEIERMLNTLFSLSLDHGVGAVSTLTSRIATSADVSLQQSLIVALASMGHAHGGATEDAAQWFSFNVSHEIGANGAVREYFDQGKKIPGYGHSIVGHDDRVETLFRVAKELNIYGQYCQFAEDVEKEIEQKKKKQIPLNIDGGIAALALDLNISPSLVTGLFIIGRIPGLLAHREEEKEQGNGLRRLPESDVEYRAH